MGGGTFKVQVYLLILASVFCIGLVGFILTEGYMPFDAAYFLIVTMATVGYGDIHPVTPAGRVLAIAVILAGVGSFVAVAAGGIELMIARQDDRKRKRKISMVIGVFFAEAGLSLIRICRDATVDLNDRRSDLLVRADWTPAQFSEARRTLAAGPFTLAIHQVNLPQLRDFLTTRRSFFIQLLQHPVLFEHEDFSDLITAVFHLEEELIARHDFTNLPESDVAHLANDLVRVYGHLVIRWLDYMEHLQVHYPYLFSLAVRTNPFDPDASVVVTG